MNILSRYIMMMFLRHTLLILVGLNAVFMVFDVLSNAETVTQNAENALSSIWHYMGLRWPTILVLVMPMAALLGAMMTMHKMVKSREMVALISAGFTIYKIALVLMIGASLLAISQFIVSEYVASESSARLRLWADNDYKGTAPKAPEVDKTPWAAAGDYIVHYKTASPKGDILREPLIIHRSADGLIDEYIHAQRGIYKDGQWELSKVYGQDFGMDPKNINGSLSMDLNLHPDDFSIPAQTYEEIRASTLWGLVFMDNDEGMSSPLYNTWFQRKLAQPLSILLMVVMVTPLGLLTSRHYNTLLINFTFIMVGFVFFVSERVLLSLGESGYLPPFLAVWAPLLVFGTMSLWFMLHKQE